MQTNPMTNDPMKRGEFLRSLGLSSAALMAFYCMGTLTACSGGGDDPAPATPSTPTTPGATASMTGNADPSKGKVDFTLDLTSNDYRALKTVGNFVNVGDLVVANAKGNNFVAIGRICPHASGNLEYQLQADNFKCAVHGSIFSNAGKVEPNQVARRDVKMYKTALSPDGNKLQVTE